MFSYFLDAALWVILQVFDPTVLVSFISVSLTYMLKGVAAIIPNDYQAPITWILSFLAGNYIAKMVGLGIWILGMFIPIAIAKAGVALLMWWWCICFAVRFAMYIKAHLWSSST